jgi:hypothetical protein
MVNYTSHIAEWSVRRAIRSPFRRPNVQDEYSLEYAPSTTYRQRRNVAARTQI